MIKVSYLEQQDAILEFDTEWEWHCMKVVLIWLSQLAIHGITAEWSLNKGFPAGCW